MKHFSSRDRISSITIIAVMFTIFACKKDTSSLNNQSVSNDNLAFSFPSENKIRINQAVIVYDSSQIKDSIDFVLPTPNKYYEWEVMPNACDSITGNKGITGFIFHCSGTYSVTAKIYDSLTHNLIGTTDTLEINVTTDTLHPTQEIKPDDVLNIQTGITKIYSDTSLLPNEVNVYLNLLSTKTYDNYSPYLQFDYVSNINTNNYNYTFSDIRLDTYPIANVPYNATDKVNGWIDLKGLSYGVPANLSITWLGITYMGTITLLNENQYIFNWDNSGAVKMK